MRNPPQQGKAQHGTTRHRTAWQSRPQRRTARNGAVQLSKALHSTARHTKAHHSTKARNANRRPNPIKLPDTQERKVTRPELWDTTTPAHDAHGKGHHMPGGTNPSPTGAPEKTGRNPRPHPRRPACTNNHRKVKPTSTKPTPQGRGHTGQPQAEEAHQPPPAPPDQ